MQKRWVTVLVLSSVFVLANEQALVDTMINCTQMEFNGTQRDTSDKTKQTLHKLASPNSDEVCSLQVAQTSSGVERLLYRFYPKLKTTLPYITLGDLPTPIMRIKQLEAQIGNTAEIYVKRDDLTGRIKDGQRSFGGNKIRKLEFLLADACLLGAKSVMTYGAIGSNHVVATAVTCKAVGLRCIAMLTPQAVADIVKRNLLLMHKYDVDMSLNPNGEIRHLQTICSYVQNKYKNGNMPYFIPTGGSCPTGIVGFVNAAFELRDQIEQGLLPEPDYIYVATGSVGTTVGLLLGVRAAGLRSKVIGIAVQPDDVNDPLINHIVRLLNETNLFLCQKDSNFPLFSWSEQDVQLRFDFSGPAYGQVTKEAMRAIDVMKQTSGLQLDTTYTGKAFAGLLHDLESGVLKDKTVLFWNTFCSDVELADIDYKVLPVEFQRYFE